MAVGIIAYQIAVIQPDDFELEESLQQMVDAVVVERLVAVRRQQALRGGEECTLSVTLDAFLLRARSPGGSLYRH